MSNQHNPEHSFSSSDLLQASWLRQSYLVGHPADQAGHYNEALAIYRNILKLEPDNILAYILQGRVLENLECREEAQSIYYRALELVKQTLQKRPGSTQTRIYQGDLLWMLGHDHEALQAYDLAIKQDPDQPEAYINKGWLLLAIEQYNESLQAYEQALALQPNNPDALYRKGCVLWEMQRYDEAIQIAKQAIMLDPTYARAYSLQSTALSYLGQEQEAKQAYAHYKSLVGS